MQHDRRQRHADGEGVERVPPLAGHRERAGDHQGEQRTQPEGEQRPAGGAAEADAGDGEQGQAHAEAEVGGPRERGEPRRPVGVGDAREHRPGQVDRAHDHQGGGQRRGDRQPGAAGGGTADTGVDQRHAQRDEHVEVELHRERPGRAVGPEDVLVAVDVGEGQVGHQVDPVTGEGRVGQRPHQQHEHDVERQQPRHAPVEQGAPRPAGHAALGGAGDRQPQHQPREHEEHVDEEVGAAHELVPDPAEGPGGVGPRAVVLVGVEGHDRQRREGAQPAERVDRRGRRRGGRDRVLRRRAAGRAGREASWRPWLVSCVVSGCAVGREVRVELMRPPPRSRRTCGRSCGRTGGARRRRPRRRASAAG